MGGGLMQLILNGTQDMCITGNPQITYFKAVHRRHTNFAIESIKQTFNGNPTIPSQQNTNSSNFTISRTGDLIHRMYLEYHNDISGNLNLEQSTSTYRFNSGVNNMSSRMIKDAIIEIGDKQIDKHYGEWLEIFAELTEPNPTGSSLSEITNNIPENDIKSISCGTNHTAILLNTNKVVTFGDNSEGQLGINKDSNSYNGVNSEELIPVDVSGGGSYNQNNAIAVSCGDSHTAILLNTGKVVKFGDNFEEQLGDNTNEDRKIPVDVSGSGSYTQDNAIAVSCGDSHTSILLNTGKVVTFGNNSSGQLGDNTDVNRKIPVDVSSGNSYTQDNAIAVSCGKQHTVILLNSGKVVTFGDNFQGQLGINKNSDSYNGGEPKELIPVDVTGGDSYTQDNAIAVSCGGEHTAILLNTGKVVTFGKNANGQLGDNTEGQDNKRQIPVDVSGGGSYTQDNAIAVSCGGEHTAILLNTGKVVTFGNNSSGQLGDNTNEDRKIPVDVSGSGSYTQDNAIAVSCGDSHTSILLNTGKVVTFGNNSSGQLGDNTDVDRQIPVDVSGGGSYDPDHPDTSGGRTLFNTLDFVSDSYPTSGTLFQKMSKMGGTKNSSYLNRDQTFVPLRFWFNRNIGLALPLIALQNHEVKLLLTLNGQDICHINSGTNISLWVDYIFLDKDERRRFARTSHQYLIEQLQRNEIKKKTENILNFNYPVKELIWKQGENNITDTNWTLNFNGKDRFIKRPTKYFTRTQVWQHHTGYGGVTIPDSIAVYSFSIKPESHQPTGVCNFTRIDEVKLLSDLELTNEGTIYAVNYNILKIMSGMAGVSYIN